MVALGAAGACAPSLGAMVRQPAALRVLGTHTTLHEPVRRRAERELGFTIEHTLVGSAELFHRALAFPETIELPEP